MRIFELDRYNIPVRIIEIWINEIGEELLPVQERAIKRYHILNGANLLISSPDTLGRTFMGEIAAVKGAVEKKKVVYFVPLKSIAEEKYLDFRKKYEPFGIGMVVSTREYGEFDLRIRAGEFEIAVIAYEKMSQLMLENPFLLRSVSILIIDDLQEIGDPYRGPELEITLTEIATSLHHPQIIGLSAVLVDADAVARWLGADLLSHNRMPVELQRSAVYKAAFQYRIHGAFEKKTEALTGMASDDSADILLANILHLIERGDQILIILKSRIDTMVFAHILSDRINLPCASDALKDLHLLEETCLKKGLRHCLRKSIAFHHEDLSREERNIVERYARKGKIKVIFCTAAMAVGMNLPATTIALHTHKRENDGSNHVTLTPICWAEYENIGRNDGIHGFGWNSGGPITNAGSDYEHCILCGNHNEGESAPTSRLSEKGLENNILNIVASGLAKNRRDLETFLSRTFMGLSESREAIRENLEKAIRFLLDNGFVEQSHRKEMGVTPLGKVVALKGITCLTALELASFFREVEDRDLTDLEILHAVTSSDDGKRVYIRVARDRHRSQKYEQFMREIFEGQQEYMGELFSYVVKSPLLLTGGKSQIFKYIRLLDRWIRGKDPPPSRRDFESYFGPIAAVAEGMSWIMDAASLIAQSTGYPQALQGRLSILSEKLLYGVEEKGLELARLKVQGLGRAGIKILVTEGFTSRKAIREVSLSVLAKLIPKKIAVSLKKAVASETVESMVVETITPDNTLLFGDRIEITGRLMDKRNLIMINDSPTGVTDRSLELLLRFGIALKKDGRGWVHREDFASGTGSTQLISRLRNELRSLTLAKDGKIIENDKSGNYRLSIPPQNVVIDTASLMKHWNAVIKGMAESV
jgi:helicase